MTYTPATTASGTNVTSVVTRRLRRTTSRLSIATTTNASARGPTQIGQVRNVATRANASMAPLDRDGPSSQAAIAHQAATAKVSATTCAMYESCANDPSV